MRLTALAFALALLAANTAAAQCMSGQVAGTGDKAMTTAQAPLQTPVPETADGES
jgi:hypothetical protein